MSTRRSSPRKRSNLRRRKRARSQRRRAVAEEELGVQKAPLPGRGRKTRNRYVHIYTLA